MASLTESRSPSPVVPLQMDRFAFLSAQTWLAPSCEVPLSAPIFRGLASLSLSLRENGALLGSAAESLGESPQGACAPDAKHLYFLTSETHRDATTCAAALHDTPAGLCLVLDGRAFHVVQPATHVVARMPTSGQALPPFVSVLFARVTLNLVLPPGSAWAVEAPSLLAAANAFERGRSAVQQGPAAAVPLPSAAESALAQWRAGVDELCAAASSGATDARLASAVALLASGTAAARALGTPADTVAAEPTSLQSREEAMSAAIASALSRDALCATQAV